MQELFKVSILVRVLFRGFNCIGVLIGEMSSFQGLNCMQELLLGKEKVSLLERCPHFRGDLRERFHCISMCHYLLYSYYVCKAVSFSPRQKFSQADWSDVCLAHLFTAVRFDDERLGVAYVASRKSNDVGGICSPCKPWSHFQYFFQKTMSKNLQNLHGHVMKRENNCKGGCNLLPP